MKESSSEKGRAGNRNSIRSMARPADRVSPCFDQPRASDWFVYVLRCADGTLYTGVTTDVRRRCKQHNDGTASRYTSSRRPARAVCREAWPDRSAALKREAAIKALSRPQKEALIRRGRRRPS